MELKAEKITCQYHRQGKGANQFTALHETDLVLASGRLVEIEGRSGSGKSTLLNIMAGILAPSSGKVLLDGQDLYAMPDEELSRTRNRRIGMIPQGQTGLRALTVLENVLLPTYLYGAKAGDGGGAGSDAAEKRNNGENGADAGKEKNVQTAPTSAGQKDAAAEGSGTEENAQTAPMPAGQKNAAAEGTGTEKNAQTAPTPAGRKNAAAEGAGTEGEPQSGTAEQRAMALLDQVGIAHLRDAWPDELSGGELRRMAIARALMMDPDILLADEPTADLDDENTKIVLTLLRECADGGRGVLLVTHEREAAAYADQVFRMSEGKLYPVTLS